MPILKQITFKDFKRFERFSLGLESANVLVGPNNAGKSSVLDALRILHGVQRYGRRIRPHLIRTSTGEAIGYEIPDASIPVHIANVVRNYGDDDAIIEFKHENGRHLIIEVHPEHRTRAYILDAEAHAHTGRAYFATFPLDVVIVPTLSPFEQEEPYVTDDTVDKNRAGRLASRHFRNLWYRSSETEFNEFADLVRSTWPGISIERPSRPREMPGRLEMFYSEDRKDREISWSGFGFQVWLQILTHMLRGTRDSFFVLDEPDIYLHPDLQSKLIRIIKERFAQFAIATHSAEIINRSTPGEIVSINSNYRSAKRIKSDSEYNQVFAYIGSIENVEIAKLSRARRVVFFEGQDKKLLGKFFEKSHLTDILFDTETLVIGVGGFGQWRRVLESAWTFRNVLQFDVRIFALFDRDYRDEREISEITKEVTSQDVQCAIWQRKELENYLLDIRALSELLVKRHKERKPAIDFRAEDANLIINTISDNFKYDVSSQYLSNTLNYERRTGNRGDTSQIAKECAQKFDQIWNNLETRLCILPGKQFIADLSTYTQNSLGFSVTPTMILNEMRASEIPGEMIDVLGKLDAFCST